MRLAVSLSWLRLPLLVRWSCSSRPPSLQVRRPRRRRPRAPEPTHRPPRACNGPSAASLPARPSTTHRATGSSSAAAARVAAFTSPTSGESTCAGGRRAGISVVDGDAEGAPPPLRSCAAAFDRHAGRLLVFGGWNGVTPNNGVWALTPGATPRWQRLCDATSCGTPPSARRAAQAVYDPIRRRLLVFGGLDTQYRNDTWELTLDGSPAWRQLPPVGPQPPARGGHSLVYDRRGRRAWLFGGTTSGPDLGDTWTFDLATDTWTALTPSACPGGLSASPLRRRARARPARGPPRAPRRLGIRPEQLPAGHLDARESRRRRPSGRVLRSTARRRGGATSAWARTTGKRAGCSSSAAVSAPPR